MFQLHPVHLPYDQIQISHKYFLQQLSRSLQKQIENLESEQAATVREKQELQKKLKTLGIIQQNFTALLDAPLFQESIEKSENVL